MRAPGAPAVNSPSRTKQGDSLLGGRILEALALQRSMIQSGERWSEQASEVYDAAKAELALIEEALHPLQLVEAETMSDSPSRAKIEIRVMGLPVLHSFVGRVQDFIQEYAWHDRDCAAVDADGEWHRGNKSCSCGFDEALAALIPNEAEV